ncbi:MAG: ABC transporter substrate-binding protein [Aggregatilineales bacterium]
MRRSVRTLFAAFLSAMVLGVGLGPVSAQTAAPTFAPQCKSGSTQINFWHGLTGPDGAYLANLVNQYNAQNTDNLCVNITVYNWDVFFDKWLSGVAAGNPPDAVVLHINEVPQYASLGAMQPIDDLAKQVGLDISGFPQTQQTYSHYDGKLYGAPLDVHPIGMYINTDIAKAAGLDVTKPPTDKASFLDWAQKMTKADGSQYGVCFASVNVQSFRVWYGWLWQNDAPFISSDNTKITINSPAAAETLQFAVDLVNKYKVAPPGETDPDTDFSNGKCGITFQGPWYIHGFLDAKVNYVTAPQPVIFKHPGVWASDHFLAVSKQSDASRQLAAAKFIKWTIDHANVWGLSGMVPADKAVREGAAYTGSDIYKYQKAFVAELDYTHLTPVITQSTAIFAENNQTPLNVNFQAALLGAKDVNTALADMQTGIQAVLDQNPAPTAASK